jgi:hypothetical protein
MFDPIRPPAASRPEEALELVSQAVSDGDLEAALAQYEKGALLACWPGAGQAGQAGEAGQVLAAVMALRLPLYVRISSVLQSPELRVPHRGRPARPGRHHHQRRERRRRPGRVLHRLGRQHRRDARPAVGPGCRMNPGVHLVVAR